MLSSLIQVLTLLEEAKNGRVGVCHPPSMPVPSSPLSPQSATALFAVSIVRPLYFLSMSCDSVKALELPPVTEGVVPAFRALE